MSFGTAWVSVGREAAGEAWHVRGPARLEGVLRPPGDKSIAHRALLLAALARGTSTLCHLPDGADVQRTLAALVALGVRTERRGGTLRIHGVGPYGLRPAVGVIDCGNSGTTLRLLAGLLAPQPFESILVGDASLSRRPMRRVAEPLAAMGARVACLGAQGRPPLRVGGGTAPLRGVEHRLEVDSAQVRSALLLAGLHAGGPTRIRPAGASRDHTERMLQALGIRLESDAHGVLLHPTLPGGWSAFDLTIPGDLSSAAFHVAFASAVRGSRLRVDRVGLNPGRSRYLELLREHGARLEWRLRGAELGEPWGEVRVTAGSLSPLRLMHHDTVRCIDEIPALTVGWAAAGASVEVRDAGELRVKESDRIAKLVELVTAFGWRAHERPQGFDIDPRRPSSPGRFDCGGDHRLAMAAAMLALTAPGESVVASTDCVRTSYPDFVTDLVRIVRAARKESGPRARRTDGGQRRSSVGRCD